MAKAAIEGGVGATGISDLMVRKELQLGTLRTMRIIDNKNKPSMDVEIVRPFFKLKHRQRFQTALAKTFEETLLSSPLDNLHQNLSKLVK